MVILFLSLIPFLFMYMAPVQGVRYCYNCSTVVSRHSCLDIPENSTDTFLIPCKYFCTIKRMEFINVPRHFYISAVVRNCEKSPEIFDGVVVSGVVTTYHRACNQNLCNGGDGLSSLRDMLVSPNEMNEDDDNGSDCLASWNPFVFTLLLCWIQRVICLPLFSL